MEEINIEELGYEIEYTEEHDIPISKYNRERAIKEVAEKVNEIIRKIKSEIHPNF